MTDTNTPASELLPCPFCGGEAMFIERWKGLWNVGCRECDTWMDPDDRSQEACREEWNARASQPTPNADAVEVLRRHHEWHLAQSEDEHGINLAEAYSDSKLCDDTVAALSKQPDPTDVERMEADAAIDYAEGSNPTPEKQPDNELADAADSEPSGLADAHQIVMRTIYGDRLIDMGATLGVPSMVTFDQAVRAAATALRNQPSVDDVIEQCAKVADEIAEKWGKRWQDTDDKHETYDNGRIAGWSDGAASVAQAIRALADKGGA